MKKVILVGLLIGVGASVFAQQETKPKAHLDKSVTRDSSSKAKKATPVEYALMLVKMSAQRKDSTAKQQVYEEHLMKTKKSN